jgi:hypothetical protein
MDSCRIAEDPSRYGGLERRSGACVAGLAFFSRSPIRKNWSPGRGLEFSCSQLILQCFRFLRYGCQITRCS